MKKLKKTTQKLIFEEFNVLDKFYGKMRISMTIE